MRVMTDKTDIAEADQKDAPQNTKGLHKRLVGEVAFRRLGFLGVCGAISAVAVAVGAYQMAQVTEAIVFGGSRIDACWPGLLIFLVMLAVRAVMTMAEGVLAGRLASDMAARFRARLFDAIHARGVALAKEQTGELTASMLVGAGDVALYYAHFLPQAVRAAVITVILVACVGAADLLSAILVVVTIPLIPLFMVLIGFLTKKKADRQWREMARLGAHLYDVLAGLGTLKLFGRSREQAEVVARMSSVFATRTMQVLKVAFLSAFMLELTATLSTAMVAVSVGLRLVYAEAVFVESLFVLLLVPEVYLSLRRLGAQFHTAVVSLPAAARLYEMIDGAQETDLPHRRTVGCSAPPAIEMTDLVYSYGDKKALRKASLTVRAGCVTAIVGRSGSGKTTMLRLAARLMAPDSGTVVIDGTEAADWEASCLRGEIAYALQSVHLFRRSVADNIALGGASEDAIVRAAQAAQADDFIRALPQGYDTMLGDGGHRLSGGQVRRIALARAFCHGGRVLLLDEWTEGLDAQTEQAIARALETLRQGKTVLMVAHRLKTAMAADYVAVMDDGRVVEYGTPAKLIKSGGTFARMVRSLRQGEAIV